jgi:hypothetical protein
LLAKLNATPNLKTIAVHTILLTPTHFITVHTILNVSMDITMVVDGNTAGAPSCAPSQSLFDDIDDLPQMYLTDRSIKFCCVPVNQLLIVLLLDQLSIVQEIDIF